MMVLHLTKRMMRELRAIAIEDGPREAAGVIVNETSVVVLSNHAADPYRHFELYKEDIRVAVSHLQVELESLVIWHTHPGGGVGPSRADIRHRTPGIDHLVITVVDGDIIPTWY